MNLPNKKKIINDPVYGFVNIPFELIYDLIEHLWFQRLRRIKQLGLSYLVYPGAQHTRFQHVIGAMSLTFQAVEILKSKGIESSYYEVAKNLKERDFIDSTRAESPLIQVEDAIFLDNSNLNREEQVELVLKLIKSI